MRQFLKGYLARATRRLLAIEAEHRAQLRIKQLAAIACVDESALIDLGATISSYSANPADIVIGPLCSIHGHILVMPQGGRVTIGEKSLVGPDTRIWAASSISIGRYVMISHNVNILDNINHSLSWRERREEINRVYPHLTLTAHTFDLKAEPIVIEDDVWIGHGSTVLKGVRVGRGAVVGCDTVVTRDIKPFSVVVGNPMRLIRTVESTGQGEDV